MRDCYDYVTVAIQSKHKKKLLKFTKEMFDEDFDKEVIKNNDYYELIVYSYHFIAEALFYLDDDISMFPIMDYQNKIFKVYPGPPLNDNPFDAILEIEGNEKASSDKEAIYLTIKNLIKDNVHESFYQSKLFYSMVDFALIEYIFSEYHSEKEFYKETQIKYMAKHINKIGENQINKYAQFSYKDFKEIIK